MTYREQANDVWEQITGQMFQAKKAGMNPRELAVHTDEQAIVIIAAALQAQGEQLATCEARVWEEAAQVVEAHTNQYNEHDCVEQDCKPWIAKELRAHASRQGKDEK